MVLTSEGYINVHYAVQIYSCYTKIHVSVHIYNWNTKMHHNKAWKHLSTSMPPITWTIQSYLSPSASLPAYERFTEHLPKTKHKNISNCEAKAQYMHPCMDKDSWKIIRARFAILFDFKTGNEMHIKLNCQLLSVSAPLSNCYDLCIGIYLPSLLEDLTWSRAGNWRAMPYNS